MTGVEALLSGLGWAFGTGPDTLGLAQLLRAGLGFSGRGLAL